MDISELKGTVLQRFQELTDDEMGILQSLEQHPVGEVIMKLIGPELTEIFSEPEDETEQMLADDIPREMYERAPIEGRSQGGNELPPMRARDPSLLQDRKGEREMAFMGMAGPNTEEHRVDPMTYRKTPDIP